MTEIKYSISLENVVIANKQKIKIKEKVLKGQIGKEKQDQEMNI